LRPPSNEQEAVAQMEYDALTRSSRILRRLVQRTSKAARIAARSGTGAAAATTTAEA
jgi:hypothetical protein